MKTLILILFILTPSLCFSQLSSVAELVSKGILKSSDLNNWLEEYQKGIPNNELCSKLHALEDRELIYFETVVSAQGRPCFQGLAKRIQSYNKQMANQHFQAYFSSLTESYSNKGLSRLRSAPYTSERPELGLVDSSTGPVYVTGDLPAGHVALTFDDGPHPNLTPEVLEILKRYSVKGTFFTVGKNVKKYPYIVQDLYREGHSYGSHTIGHPNLANLSYRSAVQEIEGGLNRLTEVTGNEMRFFRFPYASTTPRLKRYLKREGIASFFWNIDSLDWKHRNPTLIYNEVVQLLNQKKRGIILFHDIVGATPSALETLLQELTRKGYRIVHFRPKKEL